jgi:hypothetical protein
MDTAIARQRLAELEMQVSAVIGPPGIPEATPEQAATQLGVTPEQAAFLHGKTWTRDLKGTIIVVHQGPLHGPIPRGVICRPGSNKTLRRRHAR